MVFKQPCGDDEYDTNYEICCEGRNGDADFVLKIDGICYREEPTPVHEFLAKVLIKKAVLDSKTENFNIQSDIIKAALDLNTCNKQNSEVQQTMDKTYSFYLKMFWFLPNFHSYDLETTQIFNPENNYKIEDDHVCDDDCESQRFANQSASFHSAILEFTGENTESDEVVYKIWRNSFVDINKIGYYPVGQDCTKFGIKTRHCYERVGWEDNEPVISRSDFYNMFFVEALRTSLPTPFRENCLPGMEKGLEGYFYDSNSTELTGCYVPGQDSQIQGDKTIDFTHYGKIPVIEHNYGRNDEMNSCDERINTNFNLLNTLELPGVTKNEFVTLLSGFEMVNSNGDFEISRLDQVMIELAEKEWVVDDFLNRYNATDFSIRFVFDFLNIYQKLLNNGYNGGFEGEFESGNKYDLYTSQNDLDSTCHNVFTTSDADLFLFCGIVANNGVEQDFVNPWTNPCACQNDATRGVAALKIKGMQGPHFAQFQNSRACKHHFLR